MHNIFTQNRSPSIKMAQETSLKLQLLIAEHINYGLIQEAKELQAIDEELISLLQQYKAGFDPNQPRVPAGNPDGGQWTDDFTETEKDLNKAIEYLKEHVQSHSLGQCAKYVRRALNAGGFDVNPSGDAKNSKTSTKSGGMDASLEPLEAVMLLITC